MTIGVNPYTAPLPASKWPVWGNPPTGGYEGHWQNNQPLTGSLAGDVFDTGVPTSGYVTTTKQPWYAGMFNFGAKTQEQMIGMPHWIWYAGIGFLALVAIKVVKERR